AGRPAIEPRNVICPGCRRFHNGGRQYRVARECECEPDPAWSKTLACAYGLHSGTGRSPCRPRCGGPHREGDEPKPMMHGAEKSDPLIVRAEQRVAQEG